VLRCVSPGTQHWR